MSEDASAVGAAGRTERVRLRERFHEAADAYTDQDWEWLAAVASERGIGSSFIDAWPFSAKRVNTWLAEGFLIRRGTTRPIRLSLGLEEPALEVHRELRQIVLRRAHQKELLASAVQRSGTLLGSRSEGSRALRLQLGTWVLRPGSKAKDTTLANELYESVVTPFSSDWFLGVWGSKAGAVALQILDDALIHLRECDGLLEWARETEEEGSLEGGEPMCELLSDHVLHRSFTREKDPLRERLSTARRMQLDAVTQFQNGHVELSRQLAVESFGFGTKRPQPSAWSPLLALILHSSEAENDSELARTWLSSRGTAQATKDANRAFRVLLAHEQGTESVRKRINPHQLPSTASAWETLILGLTVYRFVSHEITRRGWAQLLEKKGQVWLTHGYLWMSRQALVLAKQLAPENEPAGALSPRPGDLCDLYRVREEWEERLSQLARLDFNLAAPELPLRVQWFVEPATGSLARPNLQRYELGKGWSAGERLPCSALYSHRKELPIEDRRVLDAISDATSRDGDDGNEFPHAAAIEALIHHPRVLNGTVGGLEVSVVSGTCAIETEDLPDSLRISVVPPGLGPGLNLLREGDERIVVIDVSPAMYQVVQAVPRELTVPQRDAPQALKVLAQLGAGIAIKSPHLDAESFLPADSQPSLRISALAGAWLIECGVRPFTGGGRFFPPGKGPIAITSIVSGRKVRTERNLQKEKQLSAGLIASCPALRDQELDETTPENFWSVGKDEILPLLSELRSSPIACHLEWPEGNAQTLRSSLNSGALQASLKAKKGWYLLRGSIAIDEVTSVALAELVEMPTVLRGRFVQLPSGEFLEVESKVRRVLGALAGLKAKKGDPSALPVDPARLVALREFLDEGAMELDEASQAALKRWDQISESTPAVPTELKADLRDYQLEGFQWLKRLSHLGLGACLADDMGLGKTLQIIAYLLSEGGGKKHLVVAPTSVCTNWVREIRRFAPSLQAVELHGPQRTAQLERLQACQDSERSQVFITSYGLLHSDSEDLASVPWHTVILDEAQYIKNAKSYRAQAAYALPARMKIAATGTPIENHLGDVWSLFRFLNPALLGGWSQFQTHFVKPVQRDDDHEAKLHLRELIRPYLLRRTKAQVLTELPPLTTNRKEILLSDEESMRYASLRREIHDKLFTRAGKENNKLEILAEISRLRRFCCHPKLVFPDAPSDSRKLDALVDLVGELKENGHQALIFSQYVDFLELARERISETGVSYEYLDGSTRKAERQRSIDRFQQEGTPLFLISLKAGGLGLNLTAADYVIHLDPWWNPAVKSQATDRAHRFGQERPVTVYEFVTKDTIEEEILQLHKNKGQLADTLLDKGEMAGKVSFDELRRWLRDSGGSRAET